MKQIVILGLGMIVGLIFATRSPTEFASVQPVSKDIGKGDSNYLHHQLAQQEAVAWSKDLAESKRIYGSTPETLYSIISPNGDTNYTELENQGLTKEQQAKAGKALQNARQEMSDSLRSRLAHGSFRLAPRQNASYFFAPSDRPQGDKILEKLKFELIESCGPEKGAELFTAIRPGQQFGCFGRQDIEISMKEDPHEEIGYLMTAGFFSPETKTKLYEKHIKTFDELNFFFGNSFEIETVNN